jgi:signal transduction histidine kinase
VSRYYYLALDLLYCFNAILFVPMAFLSLQQYRKRRTRWGGIAYVALVNILAVLCLTSIAGELVSAILRHRVALVELVDNTAELLIPALLFHLVYHNEREHVPFRRGWKACLAALYAIGAIEALTNDVGIDLRPGLVFPGLMGCAAVGSGALLWISRRDRSGTLELNQRRCFISLCAVVVCLCLLDAELHPRWLGLLWNSLPLCFLFAVTYYVERFTFFDVLIKKGAFVFISFFLLSLYFVFVVPRLQWITHLIRGSWFSALTWAASLLPIVLLAPWGHRKLSVWLDRLCLGRRFAPAEASKYFLDGLQGAIDGPELMERAAEHLSAIFQSEAEVALDASRKLMGKDCDDAMRAPLRIGGRAVGVVVVRPRRHNVRFLSEDAALLASLAEGLSFLLENLRLREKRLEQEKRERELVLNAHRSELKALRAQVNPHFLFNALNTIAGLIPGNPDQAERTIEQLAEVFRYTLRRSEREWVRLDDELEAVRAYLDIEQARFRDRLCVRVTSSGDAGNRWIPAMTVQTLVENAVKHGVGGISAPGVVEIEADVLESRLRIQVRDNGPGFEAAAMRAVQTRGNGYGLRNIRERLRGHFGDAASLNVERDTRLGMTVVSVEMPQAAVPQPVEV